jgi:hypothetical protein
MAKHQQKGKAKKKAAASIPELTEGEQDLLSQMQNGYQLETDSLGSNPVLRSVVATRTSKSGADALWRALAQARAIEDREWLMLLGHFYSCPHSFVRARDLATAE